MNVPKAKYLKYYLLGFTDAEGCFSISLKKEDTARFGWALDPLFQITQHKCNREVLEMFQKELKCGRIIEKYPLLTKYNDFWKFKEVILGLENKMHHKKDTFIELIKKCYEMNLEGKQRRYKIDEILGDIE